MSEFEDIVGGKNAEKPESNKSYGEIQKERRQKCYDLLDEATKKAVGTPDDFKSFLSVESRFEKYSLNNGLLIYGQRPEATKLKDYDSWEKDGCQVKKGSKGVYILEPQTYKSKEGDERVSYNVKSVFDVSDVEGAKPERKVVYNIDILIRALVSNAPANIATNHEYPANVEDNSYYDVAKNTVFVRAGLTHSDIFLAVAEGLAHAEIASGVDDYRPNEHAFTARSAAYVIAKKYGVDTKPVNIGSVPSKYSDMDAKDIRAELSEIHKSVESISDRMTEYLLVLNEQNKKRDVKGAR